MSKRSSVRGRGVLCAAWIGLAATLAGCGRGGLTSDLSVQPQAQPLPTAESATLSLPQDKPFAIALAPTEELPGLGGTADADAHATKEGNADARAEVKNGGKATAGFQLGHALKNDSERQVDCDFKVRCRYEYQSQATPPSGVPDATVRLMLYARTARNLRLTELKLLEHSTDNGAVSEAATKELSFTLTLGPGETVNVYLGGEVKVDVADDHSAAGTLKVGDLTMDVVTHAAPPVAKAENAKP